MVLTEEAKGKMNQAEKDRKRATALAWEAYKRIEKQAEKTYRKTVTMARTKKAMNQATRVRNKTTNSAWKTLKKAEAQAEKTFKKAIARVRKL